MERYGIIVGFFGFMVNFLLALGANQLSGYPPSWKRLLPAALVGGIHAAASLVSSLYFLNDLQWRLIGLAVMGVVAFGSGWDSLGRITLFVLLRLSLDGIASGGIWPMILFGALVILLCRMGDHSRGNFADVSIFHNGKHVTLKALLDTGNTLRDPITGKKVMVLSGEIGEALISLPRDALRHPLETLEKREIPGLRLIPYTAIGMPSGMLLGLKVDAVRINGQPQEYIVAFAPQSFGNGKGYQALVGGNV